MKLSVASVFALCAVATLVIGATVTKPPVPKQDVLKRLPGLKSAAVTVTAVPLTISWDYPVAELSTDLVFRVYHATNIVVVPVDWSLATSVTGVTMTTMSVIPGSHYFAVRTYSQFWGIESPPSGTNSTPPAPQTSSNLSIKK